jgi:AcrR family transcriptional regulator
MVRRHGWAGSPPADELEARTRIVGAAIRCVDHYGPDRLTLSEVAKQLGVTRPTVYRYYSGIDDLLAAVGAVAAQEFLDELTEHLKGVLHPAEWVVEALASAIELLPKRPYLTLLLVAGHAETFARGVTSPLSMGIGRDLFKRSHLNWVATGFDEDELDELIELMLRIFQSMIVNPPVPPRTGSELRNYLRRWIAPAIAPGP